MDSETSNSQVNVLPSSHLVHKAQNLSDVVTEIQEASYAESGPQKHELSHD